MRIFSTRGGAGLLLATALGFSGLPAVAGNLISNGTFDSTSPHHDSDHSYPWMDSLSWSGTADFSVSTADERYCVDVAASGANPWDITIRVEGLDLMAGETYVFSGELWSTQEAVVNAFVAHEPPFNTGYETLASKELDILDGPQAFSIETAPAEDRQGAYVGFQMGGDGLVPAGTTVCFDNMVLFNENYVAPEPVPPAKVQINQLGYLPAQDKRAVYVLPEGASNTPRDWSLSLNGTLVESGQTFPVGEDAASGNSIQWIDFDEVTTEGNDYVLTVMEDGQAINSASFAIAGDLYTQLKKDALAYFYMNRASSEVEEDVVGADLARAAGHPDVGVETYACNSALREQPHLDPAFFDVDNCLELDVAKGWYDAGDYGKYVVNGGIAVWTMMNQYERARHLGANAADFADGSLALPATETSNGIPDILDEARWQLEWILSMQVPTGQPYAGMAHHKMHGDKWPTLPSYPAEDDSTRYIWPPSTAATLNLAAVGAQCYRVFTGIDDDFAAQCLSRAQTAYQAAENNVFLRSPYTVQADDGGGAYEDNVLDPSVSDESFVADEYYWAATELYLATGNSEYADDMAAYAGHLAIPGSLSAFEWSMTAGLGTTSLAVAGKAWTANDTWVETARDNIIGAASHYAASTEESYGLPFDATQTYWGSNSTVVNNMILLGLARDFSGCKAEYSNALQSAASYLLGRNPMDTAYITGTSAKAAEAPHHRVWAQAKVARFPAAPPGVLLGGPNMSLDNWERHALSLIPNDCAPLTCYVDHMEAYAQNEVTVNWNAPLAWVLAYMDEMGSGRDPQTCDGDVVIANNGTLELPAGEGNGYLDLSVDINDGLQGEYALQTQASTGTAIVSTNGAVEFVPNNDFVSGDTFTYTVTVDGETSAPATITVTREDIEPLIAVDGTIDLDLDDTLNLQSLNDSAVGDVFVLVSQASEGEAVINGNNVTYIPSASFSGNDSFTYRIEAVDGRVSTVATITVSGSQEECTAPAWSASATYTGGEVVSYKGVEYRAMWWLNPGDFGTPDTTNSWGPWEVLGNCGGDGDLLTLSPSVLHFDQHGGSANASVTANISWTATSSDRWLTLSPTSGSNNGSLTVNASVNNGAQRTGTITLAGGGMTRTLTVTQAAGMTDGTCGYEVTYETHEFHNKWNALLTITNNTGSTMDSWEVILAYPEHTTLGAWGGPGTWDAVVSNVAGAGNQYRLHNQSWNGTLYPGDSLTIHLDGSSGPPPEPGMPIIPAGIPDISGPVCGN